MSIEQLVSELDLFYNYFDQNSGETMLLQMWGSPPGGGIYQIRKG